MTDIETVVNGLNDIGGFITGRVGIEQARNFLRTIDEAVVLLKEQQQQIWEFQDQVEYLTDKLKEQEGIIKQYQKADGFLFAHGWKCEGR